MNEHTASFALKTSSGPHLEAPQLRGMRLISSSLMHNLTRLSQRPLQQERM